MDLTFGGKIKEARKAKNLTQKQLAEKIGAKHNSVSDWENNKNKPDPDTIELLCGVLDITPNYLLSLETVEFSPVEKLLIKKYRSLDPHGQDMVDTILVKEYERASKYGKLTAPATIIEFHPKQDNNLLVLPYFRAGVSAGTGIFILGNEAEDDIELPALPEYEAADFAIDVNGDSMEPDFSHEDIALVQRDAEMHIGDIGVFIVNGDAFIKELGEKELISRNKDYKNIPIHEGDNVVCMGKVIGKVMY
jgi:transcriptional regulator with XRE-family HTH domain